MSLFTKTFLNDDLFDNRINFMKTDIFEINGEYNFKIELPGFSKDDIQIDVNNGYLIVKANKQNEYDENTRYIRKERYYGDFERSFYVGYIDIDEIKASYNNGILTINFPKENKLKENKKQIHID